MKIGIQLPRFKFPGGTPAIGPTFASYVKAADDAGFASLWVMDHFFQIEYNGPAEDPMLEAYTALGFAAGLSSHVKLGTMVTGVTYRHPGVLTKTVTTLDVLSGGRAYLGIGAAWFEREHRALGVPYPPLAERFERLEETLQIVHQMWSGEVKPYGGTHYRLEETLNQPQPITSPHPPILIGGGGEQKTLRLVAQYADACNLFSTPELPHKLDVLKRHCDTLGRDYAEIEKTTLTRAQLVDDGAVPLQTPAEILEIIRQHAELGIDQVILNLPGMIESDLLTRVGREIVEPAQEIVVAGR